MPDEKQLDFENMDDEQLLDALNENPKSFVDTITRQVRADIERENAQKAQEDQFIKTFEDFQQQHPGFQEKWDSGEIKQFMEKHPGHNALSSYLALTDKARIERAVQSKLAERGLSDRSGLDNPGSRGSTRVLADRLKAMRSQGGGKTPPTEGSESGDLKPTM